MNRYITFNPDKFLRESKRWKQERKELMLELGNILELPAISNSEVHSTNISDPTARTAERKLAITQELNRLDSYEKLLEYGLSHLTDQERAIIKAFYFDKGYIGAKVEMLAGDLDCSVRQVYRLKTQSVSAFSRAVTPLIDNYLND